MITAWAVPAPLPAYIGVSQTTEIPVAPDFADTLVDHRLPPGP
jgi:hypothetical protein